MADDNDKSPLIRRRVLGGMATIGAAGAVGAGTWAEFSDSESTSVTATAGTLDLSVTDGSDPVKKNYTFSDVKPGDSGSKSITLENTGNISGDLTANVSNITNNENGRNDPEVHSSDTSPKEGELGEKLDITLSGGGKTFGPKSLDWFSDKTQNLGELSEEKSIDFTIDYSLPYDSAGNEVQSDSVEFDVTFDLKQQKSNP